MATLQAAGVDVATINSTTKAAAKSKILADLQCGHPRNRLLYVTPEYCALENFRSKLRFVYEQRQLSRIAIDEAHCISEWGHDFRPSFQQLSFFKQEFPSVPMMCLTATATRRVREDIISTLGLNVHGIKLFTMTTCRPNLHYEVRFKNDETDYYDDFLRWLKSSVERRAVRFKESDRAREESTSLSGIIYTIFRKDCEILAARLCSDSIGAKPYHAGLTPNEKEDYLRGWVEGSAGYEIIVATTAFGMGIDKDDVRFVIHWQIPKSFEGFYQEAGRAGRDGKAACCIMYYSREDRDRAIYMQSRDQTRLKSLEGFGSSEFPQAKSRVQSLQFLIDYCECTQKCRHELINQYFGGIACIECDWACDWHKDQQDLVRRKSDILSSEEWCSTQRDTGALVIHNE